MKQTAVRLSLVFAALSATVFGSHPAFADDKTCFDYYAQALPADARAKQLANLEHARNVLNKAMVAGVAAGVVSGAVSSAYSYLIEGVALGAAIADAAPLGAAAAFANGLASRATAADFVASYEMGDFAYQTVRRLSDDALMGGGNELDHAVDFLGTELLRTAKPQLDPTSNKGREALQKAVIQVIVETPSLCAKPDATAVLDSIFDQAKTIYLAQSK